MMRGLKMWLACAVVGAAMVSAAAGAGTASAATTELCEVSTSPCPSGKAYPTGTTFAITGEFGINPITGCEFTYKFKTTAASGTPTLPSVLNSFTFTHCGTGYTVKPIALNWEYGITVTLSGPNGTGKMLPTVGKTVGFEVEGNGEINCQYTAASFPQSITGGGLSAASMVSLTKTGGTGCVTPTVSVSMGGLATPKFYVTE